MLKLMLSLAVWCLVQTGAEAAEAANDGPAAWDEIRIGMPIDEVTELLRGKHAHASLTRPDGSGTKKFWPVDMPAIVAANAIERAYFPHGHVLIIEFDSRRMITGMSRTFVSEQEYEASLSAIQRAE